MMRVTSLWLQLDHREQVAYTVLVVLVIHQGSSLQENKTDLTDKCYEHA